MENNKQTANPTDQLPSDQVIIEEKISKVNGEIAVKRYSRGKLLGKGGFAKCYEATNLETKKIYAAKIIPKSQLTKNRQRQKLISEIKIHKSLHNNQIVHFEHVFEDHEFVYILLEICTNQTLNELIKRRKRLTEIEVQCYILQIVYALKYLHECRVIHRDLKLGNLFLTDKMELKIGDFGLATKLEFDGELKKTICGTPNYIAPEVLDGKMGHSYEVDVWSLGVVMYTMLIGKPPYETPDVKTTYKKIKMNNYSFPENIQISENARNLITQILNLDPQKRPTLDAILQHSFLNYGHNIPKLLPLSTLACPPSENYKKYFEYMEKKSLDKQDTVQQYTFKEHPKELQKKVTLLQHFKNYLEGEQPEAGIEDYKRDQPLVYMKKWMKTRHAIMFRLSNKIVQVNFTDRTEIILSSELKQLTYVNKKGERLNYPLVTALESQNIEMTKRLKYTKEILAHMLNAQQNQAQKLGGDRD